MMGNINEIKTMMEQYKQNGGDMSELAGVYRALSATGKTPLGLNQWQKSDKPTMDDFNSDNKLIDDSIRELQAKKVNVGVPSTNILPLTQNISGDANYSKNAVGVVTISFHVNKVDNKAFEPVSNIIAQLPVGFRPIFMCCGSGIHHNLGALHSTMVLVSPDGKIDVRIHEMLTGTNTHYTSGTLAFQSTI